MIKNIFLFFVLIGSSEYLFANQMNKIYVPHYYTKNMSIYFLGQGVHYPSQPHYSSLAGSCAEGDLTTISIVPEFNYDIAMYKKNDGSFHVEISGLYITGSRKIENSHIMSDVVNNPNRPNICGTGYVQEIRFGSYVYSEASLNEEYNGPLVNKSFSRADREKFIQSVADLLKTINPYIKGSGFGMSPFVDSFWNRQDSEKEKNLADVFDRYLEELLKSGEKSTNPIDSYLVEVK